MDINNIEKRYSMTHLLCIEYFDKLWDNLYNLLESAGLKIVVAIAALVVGLIIIKILDFFAKKILARGKLDHTVASFLASLIRFILGIILVFIVASILNIPMTSFIALLSAAGLAISLALQGSLGNMANGLVIVASKPFREGDYIQIGDINGTVKSISLVNTQLKTPDNKIIYIPNSTIISSNVINFNSQFTRRLDLNISVSYDSDIDKVKSTILDTATKHPKLLDDPEPLCRLNVMNSNSLDFILKVWCKADDYWDLYYDLNENIFKALKQNKIDIPYPQLDVHLKENKDNITKKKAE